MVMEVLESSYIAGVIVKWCNHFGKQFAVSSQTVKIELPYDPAIPFFDIYPRMELLGHMVTLFSQFENKLQIVLQSGFTILQ